MCCEKSQHIFFVCLGWCYMRTSGTHSAGWGAQPTTVAALLSRGLRANAYLRHAAGALQRWCAVVLRDEACCVFAWVGAVRVPSARTPLVGVHSPRLSLRSSVVGYEHTRTFGTLLTHYSAGVLCDEVCCVMAWLVLYAYFRHALRWLGCTAHDRRCRSSVVGYQHTCASGTLPLWYVGGGL